MADTDNIIKLCACGCGEPVKAGWYRENKFVSGHNSRTHRKPRVHFSCEQCGTVVTGTAAWIKGRSYCSAHCRDEFRRTRVGIAHPHYKRTELTCLICGVSFEAQPKRLKRQCDTYCSMECGRQGRRRKIAGKSRRLTRPATGIHAAKKRDKFACRICAFDIIVHGHHILPKRFGGLHDLENIITLCPNHHAMAHAGLLTVADLQAAMTSVPHNPLPLVYRAKHAVEYRVVPT